MSRFDPPHYPRFFRGVWHLKDAPDVVQSGQLEVSGDGLSELDLNGSLLTGTAGGYEVVFGTVDGTTSMTLDGAHYREQKANGLEGIVTVHSELWSAWAVAVGAELPEGRHTKISSLIFESPMLRSWVEPIGPRFKNVPGAQGWGGFYEDKDPIVTRVLNDRLEISWGFAGSFGGRQTRLRSDPRIRIDYENPQTIEDTWHRSVVPLLQMFTFFVGAGDRAESLRYVQAVENPEDIELPFEWLTSSWMAQGTVKDAPHWVSQPLPAAKVEARIPDLISRWFGFQAAHAGVLLDYFSVKMWPSMTLEESFYRVARSLEVLHGELDPTPHVPTEEFREIKNALKNALKDLGSPYSDFILGRMRHADKQSLRERIINVLGRVDQRFLSWFPETTDPKQDKVHNFASRAVAARDAMTHTGQENPLGDHLRDFYMLLDLTMTNLILLEIGLSAAEAWEYTYESDAFRPFRYRVE